MRNRITITIVAVVLTLSWMYVIFGGKHPLPLGKELYSGTGKVYYSTAASDGIRDFTFVTFTKDGHGKTFTFCDDNADLFADRAFKYSMSFRWNPEKKCDQLTGVTREMGKHWDTVWFWWVDDPKPVRAPIPF